MPPLLLSPLLTRTEFRAVLPTAVFDALVCCGWQPILHGSGEVTPNTEHPSRAAPSLFEPTSAHHPLLNPPTHQCHQPVGGREKKRKEKEAYVTFELLL